MVEHKAPDLLESFFKEKIFLELEDMPTQIMPLMPITGDTSAMYGSQNKKILSSKEIWTLS